MPEYILAQLRWQIDQVDPLSRLLVRSQIERAEAVAGIRRGLEDMKAGKGIPFEEFDRKMRKKYAIPRDSK